MKEFEEVIAREGKVYPGNVLKVDSFLNHQLDVELIDKLGQAFYERFKDKGVTRILTIEASGIAIACAAARFFKVPVVFAKKSQSLNLGGDVYVSRISSYTYGKEYDVIVSTDFLKPGDKVLLIDDFMAIGNAMKGLLEICEQAGAEAVGIGICIEKAFQKGGDDLRKMGYDVMSLAIIDSMSPENGIRFRSVRQ